MKKILFIATLLLAFGINATAQEKTAEGQQVVKQEVSEKEKMYSDIQKLNELVKIPQSLQDDFITLLQMRNDAVANAKNEEDKKVIFNKLSLKMTSALSKEQLQTLQSNKELYTRLFLFEGK